MKVIKLFLLTLFLSCILYSQDCVGKYTISRYVASDTCWIVYAVPFDTHCKPFPFEFDFWCSQTFKNKYKVGSIFDYAFCYYKEDYIRIMPPKGKRK